jgi:hypothetical protein
MVKGGLGRKASPAGRNFGDDALVLVVGGLLVINGSEGISDEVLGVTVGSGVRSARPMASCRE